MFLCILSNPLGLRTISEQKGKLKRRKLDSIVKTTGFYKYVDTLVKVVQN